jgi:hypothetical protein
MIWEHDILGYPFNVYAVTDKGKQALSERAHASMQMTKENDSKILPMGENPMGSDTQWPARCSLSSLSLTLPCLDLLESQNAQEDEHPKCPKNFPHSLATRCATVRFP